MTTYRRIHGRSIQAVTTDPTESVAEGQVWYNTTSDTFKSVVVGSAWASSSPVLTARYGTSGAGTQTAGLMFAGNNSSSGDAQITNTEEYNGSGWATGGALPTGTRSGAGFELKLQLCLQVVMMDQILEKLTHIMELLGQVFLLLIQQDEV